jgi:hypothetical protein
MNKCVWWHRQPLIFWHISSWSGSNSTLPPLAFSFALVFVSRNIQKNRYTEALMRVPRRYSEAYPSLPTVAFLYSHPPPRATKTKAHVICNIYRVVIDTKFMWTGWECDWKKITLEGKSRGAISIHETSFCSLNIVQASANYGMRAKRGTRSDFSMARWVNWNTVIMIS